MKFGAFIPYILSIVVAVAMMIALSTFALENKPQKRVVAPLVTATYENDSWSIITNHDYDLDPNETFSEKEIFRKKETKKPRNKK